MRIFHILPYNPIPSGGIKVHYQAVELERELGYESYIVYPDNVSSFPTWFRYEVRHLSISEMNKLADKKMDVIVGWEEDEILYRSGFRNKVMYVQGEVFLNRSKMYHGLDIWISSHFNEMMLPQFSRHRKFFVSPFIDKTRFYYDPNTEKRTIKLLTQVRKGGKDAVDKLKTFPEFYKFLLSEDNVKFIDVDESTFIDELRNAEYFFAHSYPEGLGLTPLEAMACGAIVIGFHGGGGTDFMENGRNCFVANRDGDYAQLVSLLMAIDVLSKEEKEAIRKSALETANVYSRERTLKQLDEALSIYRG